MPRKSELVSVTRSISNLRSSYNKELSYHSQTPQLMYTSQIQSQNSTKIGLPIQSVNTKMNSIIASSPYGLPTEPNAPDSKDEQDLSFFKRQENQTRIDLSVLLADHEFPTSVLIDDKHCSHMSAPNRFHTSKSTLLPKKTFEPFKNERDNLGRILKVPNYFRPEAQPQSVANSVDIKNVFKDQVEHKMINDPRIKFEKEKHKVKNQRQLQQALKNYGKLQVQAKKKDKMHDLLKYDLY